MQIEERIREVMNEVITLPETVDASFELEKLGLDSLDVAEFVVGLEEEFADEHLEIDDEVVPTWTTYGDVVGYVTEKVK